MEICAEICTVIWNLLGDSQVDQLWYNSQVIPAPTSENTKVCLGFFLYRIISSQGHHTCWLLGTLLGPMWYRWPWLDLRRSQPAGQLWQLWWESRRFSGHILSCLSLSGRLCTSSARETPLEQDRGATWVKAERAGQRQTHTHLTDVVGVHFSLDELRQVCGQAVFMQHLFPFGFVSDLGEEKPHGNQVWETVNGTGEHFQSGVSVARWC